MAQNNWDDAVRNTLRRPIDHIERYLAENPDVINKVGDQGSLTLLAAACYDGHHEVVKLLLDKGACPDAPCPHGRTALFYALQQAPPNQLPIVQALLTAVNNAANPNEKYPKDGDVNPLAIAIEELRDTDIVQALVDAGARPEPDNIKQAKARKMERALDTLEKAAESFIDNATSAVSFIINHTTTGASREMYKISDARKNSVAPDIPEPKSVKHFLRNIGNFVKGARLDRFFAKKPDFLQRLAESALALRNNPTTDLGKSENIKRLTRLSLYQLVLYCDDSGSMSWTSDGSSTSDPSKSRYHSLRQLVARIAKVATKLLPDDTLITVRFINSPFSDAVTASQVDGVMTRMSPGGGTPLGYRLREKVLQPLVYNTTSNPSAELEQPLLVCIITDGAPNPSDTPLKDLVLECKTTLTDKKYEPTSVMFCISQIGADSGATTFLNGLRGETEINDVMYCTTELLDAKFAGMRENERALEVWLLEMLTKPTMRDG